MSNEEVKKYKILAVDDESANLMLLKEILQNDYHMIFAKNGKDALKRLEQKPDLVLLDIMMPEIDGYEVCQRMKADPETQNIPVIFLTAKINVQDEIKGFDLGAVDYITKPLSPPILVKRVKTHLSLYDQKRILEETVKLRTSELYESRLQIIRRLGRAAEYKDNETGLHVVRMSHYSKILATEIALPENEIELIYMAAPMHDVGKIGIPDAVLLKPGKLNDVEWAVMKQHPQMGYDIIRIDDNGLLSAARSIALNHHEKWNGKGYPNGISGEDIPLRARIIAIADVFDALTSERPYKQAWTVEKTINLLKEEAGQHFDPQLVSAFNGLPQIIEIKEKYIEKRENDQAGIDRM